MTKNGEQDLIKITHYINPHMFWYKYEDSFYRNADLCREEDKLASYFLNKPPGSAPSQSYHPKLNEVVATYNFSMCRWIRARCEDIVEFTVSNAKFILWAIDYGIPFQTESKWIRRLPTNQFVDFPQEIVYFGGIYNVVPADKEYNFETVKTEVNPSSKWSPLAVRTIENLIYESAHIRFERQLISKDSQYFGNLEFLTHTNQIIKADAALVDIRHALVTDNFCRIIRQIRTNQIPKWQTNEGTSFVSKYNVNKLSNACSFKTKEVLRTNKKPDRCASVIDEEVSRKIFDWTKRNLICINTDEGSIIDDAVSVCETNFSVQQNRKIASEKLPTEKDEDAPTILQCCAYRRRQLQKYKESIPPPPNDMCNDDQGIIAEYSRDEISVPSKTTHFKSGNNAPDEMYVVSSKIIHTKPQSNYQDEKNVEHSKTTYSKGNMNDRNGISIVPVKTTHAKLNDDLDGVGLIFYNTTNYAKCNASSMISVQSDAPNGYALSVVIKRINEKKKKLKQKLETPAQKLPQNAIPAGFDLRNLQPNRSVKDDISSIVGSDYFKLSHLDRTSNQSNGRIEMANGMNNNIAEQW